MNVKTYRANTMQEALALVRREMGPKASVLRTREVRGGGLWRWLSGSRVIEVVASTSVAVPSRLPSRRRAVEPAAATRVRPRETAPVARATPAAAPPVVAPPMAPRDDLEAQLSQLQSKVDDLCRRAAQVANFEPQGVAPSAIILPDTLVQPDALFHLFTDLIEADVNEDLARELVERVRREARGEQTAELSQLKEQLARIVEQQISVGGPIHVTPGQRRLVALVGPTGVGKTTTIAKLAANYRLREKRRVGLITVDTYRIAAVEQLRTYADIIDLPMHVVSTPREMRDTVERMSHLDLILLDTAGRSPKDEVRLQELKAFLTEAAADEVHLVLSSMTGARTLEQTAEQFATVGATSLILTKLDEVSGPGNVLPVLRSSGLPLSYLTDGQNVPDDIEIADAHRLARLILAI
jgi:flagellar biosynthesis protein FlhF